MPLSGSNKSAQLTGMSLKQVHVASLGACLEWQHFLHGVTCNMHNYYKTHGIALIWSFKYTINGKTSAHTSLHWSHKHFCNIGAVAVSWQGNMAGDEVSHWLGTLFGIWMFSLKPHCPVAYEGTKPVKFVTYYNQRQLRHSSYFLDNLQS